jgi:hypothetical protein
MAILAQCPVCRKKQSTKNKVCVCGHNLDKAKRSKKVKFWINYRLPGGQQRRELIGISIEEALLKKPEMLKASEGLRNVRIESSIS